ncbi:MAG: peptidoglycan-binding protein [Marinovum sp.]|nr:peptidoglycan-binding protein [Marinovum sp.]
MIKTRPRHTAARAIGLGVILLCLGACMQEYQETLPFTPLETSRIAPPPGAPEGTCWARDVAPAVFETRTEKVLIRPRSYSTDGKTEYPAQYETRYHPTLITPRKAFEFETVCADVITPEFIASLQRALQVRGFYLHEITGQFDTQTDAALRAYQQSQDVDTGLLTIETARSFGLVAMIFNE